MAKIIITWTNLFIICVCHVLLLTHLLYRGKNQLTRLYSSLVLRSSKNLPVTTACLLPYKMANSEVIQVFALTTP